MSSRRLASSGLLAVICAGQFMIFLDTTVVNVALPSMQVSVGANFVQLQWIVNAYTVAFACFMLSAGALADRYGAKPVFLASLSLFAATSIWCAMSSSIADLLIARFFQGVAGGAAVPVSLALLTELYVDKQERARAIGAWAAVSGLALAVGPVVGGELVDRIGWQSIFWVNVPIGLGAALILLFKLPPSRRSVQRRADPVAQILMIVAIGAATVTLMEGDDWGWISPRTLAGTGLALFALISFIAWERRFSDPMLPLVFFRSRNFSSASLINVFVFGGLYGAIFLFTLTLQVVDSYTASQAGTRLLLLSISIAIAAPIGTAIADRAGARSVLVAGTLLAAVGLVGLTTVQSGSSLSSYWWALVLLGAGSGLCGPSGTVLMLSSVPEHYAGVASATGLTARQVGAVFGVSIGTSLVLHELKSSVPADLSDLPLPGRERDAIVERITQGDIGSLSALPSQTRQDILSAVGQQFIASAHFAYFLYAAGCVVALVVALLFVRSSNDDAPDSQRAAADATDNEGEIHDAKG